MEMHTKLRCSCGSEFTHLTASELGIPRKLTGVARCPSCGDLHRYTYEFDADFQCCSWWKFWQRHGIKDHFIMNNGNMDIELFHRNCVCGKEILLKQRRTK